MNDIVIKLDVLRDNNLNINEYLILYLLTFRGQIETIFSYSKNELISLKKKGFIEYNENSKKIALKEKTQLLFSVHEDLFKEWLDLYPIKVSDGYGGTRALSPSSDDTVLGKLLRKKWNSLFKGNIDKGRKAIKVLELYIKLLENTDKLKYMVQARRWLNEGYHEKYEYLIKEGVSDGMNKGYSEDYM